MPLISITTWPTPDDKKREMMEAITQVVHTIGGAPLDKITVYIQEIERHNWSEAGVLGSAEDFPTSSRRLTYSDPKEKQL